MLPGYVCIKVSGIDVFTTFRGEPGGHRWQRVSPTEKRGRVQTSTITIAVLEEVPGIKVNIPASDIEISIARGSGKGGQHRNVTDSAVQVKHTPTGIIVRCESGRSQHQNKEQALNVLRQRLNHRLTSKVVGDVNDARRGQVGSGMRGDKVRTIRVKDDQVINHSNGKRMSYKRYLQGFIEELA